MKQYSNTEEQEYILVTQEAAPGTIDVVPRTIEVRAMEDARKGEAIELEADRVGSRIHTEPEEGMLDEDEGEKDRSRRRRKD